MQAGSTQSSRLRQVEGSEGRDSGFRRIPSAVSRSATAAAEMGTNLFYEAAS